MSTKILKALVAGAASTVLLLSGCGSVSQTESSMTRVQLYASLEQLASGSILVVVGSVTSERTVADIDDTPFTIATVQITEVIKGQDSDKTVEVRQLGGEGLEPPVALLEVGGQYLLYLTASGLPAPLDAQYYVTGANAGIYVTDEKETARGSTVFTQVTREPGEALPELITLTEAKNPSSR